MASPRRLRRTLFTALQIGALALVTGMPTRAESPQIVKMAGTAPITHHATKGLQMFKEIVEKKTGGKVQVQLYPANQLYNDKDLVLALPKGLIQAAMLNPDMWAGLVKSEGVLYFPMYYRSAEAAYRLQETDVWKTIRKDFEEQGNTKVLAIAEMGPTKVFSKRPIANLENIKGLRIRSTGEYPAVFLRALGAAPVVMSAGDMYIALQRGTIDAVVTPSISYFERKLFEVAKNGLQDPITFSTPLLIAFNLDYWKGLSPELQGIFQDAAKEVQAWTMAYAADAERKFGATLKEKGIVTTSLGAAEHARWQAQAVPVLEATYKDNVGEPKAQVILDTLRPLR